MLCPRSFYEYDYHVPYAFNLMTREAAASCQNADTGPTLLPGRQTLVV